MKRLETDNPKRANFRSKAENKLPNVFLSTGLLTTFDTTRVNLPIIVYDHLPVLLKL